MGDLYTSYYPGLSSNHNTSIMIIHLNERSFEKFGEGDEEVYKIVCDLLEAPLYAFVFDYVKRKDAAEDIVVETLYKLWVNRAKMKGPVHLQRFAYLTAKNMAIDLLKQATHEKTLHVGAMEDMGPLEELIDEGKTTKELEDAEFTFSLVMKEIEEQVERLPPKLRQVFRLRFIEGKGAGEIADLTSTALSTVYNQCREACEKIRKGLEEKGLKDLS